MRRAAFTAVELLVSIAIGLVIAGTAFAAFRMAAQANAQVVRLSTQNTLLRTGILAALDELDFWSLHDSPRAGGPRPLRDAGEPFAPAVVDPDAVLAHLPKTWFRGDGARVFAYDAKRNAVTTGEEVRFGRYDLLAGDGHAEADKAWTANHLKGLADGLGYYAACDYAPAGTIFFWYQSGAAGAERIPPRFRQLDDGANTWRSCYPPSEWGDRRAPRDLYQMSRDAFFVVSTARDPEDAAALGGLADFHRHYFCFVNTTGSRGQNPTRWSLAAHPASASSGVDNPQQRDARKNAVYERKMLLDLTPAEGGEGEGRPRHWPSLQLRRLTQFTEGTWHNHVQITLIDPITGETMNVNLSLSGSTLRGVRMLRGLDTRP